MASLSGQQLGVYLIGDAIGVGGMGEVFRGTDTKLKREVAIKVLPESFSADEDRLARFQREAEILASLNHPNIAQIYSVEESEDTTAIVMELVEGPTLADRIAEGPLPPAEAMGIAAQVINALEAAHEQQIVHRDLKPANIKLRPDGEVKVLDFGIAKPMIASGISGGRSGSPLATTPAMTETGLIMGTAAYMSPEQARGKFVDQRTDIWAFGCVFFEMLTGQPAFGGEDVTVTLARIIERDTDLDSIPAAISPAVRQALRLCLIKDPKRRIADIRDVRLALAGEFESPSGANAASAPGRPAWQLALPTGLLAALAAGATVWFIALPDRDDALLRPEVVRYDLPVSKLQGDTSVALMLGGDDSTRDFGRPFYNALAFSHDGSMLAYSSALRGNNSEFEVEIVLNRLNQNRPLPVAGTAMAVSPFFSPDDQWLGFSQDRAMKRVSLTTGNIETILSDPQIIPYDIAGAHWLDDGTIVFATHVGLYRIRDNGAELQQLAPNIYEANVDLASMPRMLPGGDTVLFQVVKTNRIPEEAAIRALDINTGAVSEILSNAQQPWYLQETGQLLFMRQGTMMAIAFDSETLATSGAPVVVADNVAQSFRNNAMLFNSGIAQFDISAAGHLAYSEGGVFPERLRRSIRVTPEGETKALIQRPYSFLNQRLSPDGRQIVFGDFYHPLANLYLHDLDRDITQSLITETPFVVHPLWSPDGQRILFSADRDNQGIRMYTVRADRSGDPEPMLSSDLLQTAASWSSQGVIAFLTGIRGENPDIWTMEEGQQPIFFSEGTDPSFSPDGNWMLYSDRDENGIPQVYVRPWPGPDPATRVSRIGGVHPTWSRDGRSIYFRMLLDEPGVASRIVLRKVEFTTGEPGSQPIIGAEETYIDPYPFEETNPVHHYDVMDDGSIIVAATDEEIDEFTSGVQISASSIVDGITEIKVVRNFVEELRQRVGQ